MQDSATFTVWIYLLLTVCFWLTLMVDSLVTPKLSVLDYEFSFCPWDFCLPALVAVWCFLALIHWITCSLCIGLSFWKIFIKYITSISSPVRDFCVFTCPAIVSAVCVTPRLTWCLCGAHAHTSLPELSYSPRNRDHICYLELCSFTCLLYFCFSLI